MLRSGDVLNDRYRLDAPIATGGMGEVWRATDTVLGRVVAVKLLRADLLADPGFGTRFRAEARMLAMLRHPGVVDVYDYGERAEATGSELAYLVMAYVDGEPLSTRIGTAGRLPATETMSIVAQAARALHAAHEAGIVHRDVKPGNLLVQPDGTVVLVDFGIARSATATRLTGVNEVIGTALYMAPEQVQKQEVSAATDIYALGAVAYHCLAGQPPFTGDTPVGIALRHLDDEPPPLPDDVPAAVRALVATAIAKNPAGRFPSAAALADAAEAAAGGETAPGAGTTVVAGPGSAAGTATAGMAGAGAVGAAAAAAGAAGPAPTAVLRTAGPGAPPWDQPDQGAGTPPAPWWKRQRMVAAIGAVALGLVALVAVLALTRADNDPGEGPQVPGISPTVERQPGNPPPAPTGGPVRTSEAADEEPETSAPPSEEPSPEPTETPDTDPTDEAPAATTGAPADPGDEPGDNGPGGGGGNSGPGGGHRW